MGFRPLPQGDKIIAIPNVFERIQFFGAFNLQTVRLESVIYYVTQIQINNIEALIITVKFQQK